MKRNRASLAAILTSLLSLTVAAYADNSVPPAIFCPKNPSAIETFASREVQRYVYQRTGVLLPIESVDAAISAGSSGFVIAEKHRPLLVSLAGDGICKSDIQPLAAQQYLLRTISRDKARVLILTGGDAPAVLFAAYRLAEHLGVRFYLHGDVIPDDRIPLDIPNLNEKASPLFDTRGIQPFHDFPEGPDWWNADDYKAIISQLPKLRMNFIGLHTYPEKAPNAEPTVWIGTPADMGSKDKVGFSYPSSYQNTIRGNWGYETTKTSDYVLGTGELFEHDAYSVDVMIGHCPEPKTPEASNEVFDRVGALLRDAFEHAHKVGVKTCVGTETPLTVPQLVQDRLKAAGKDPKNMAVVQELYEGIFRRIAQTYPIDYYWFWTPEGWTWSGTKEEQVKATLDDLQAAIAAAKNVKAQFTLATCGWVLGPPSDRALFDKVLPKDMPLTCINRAVGMDPVEPGFANVQGRPKWAIPWMEDDPALTQPQLWAGRMREDAVDALKYGCTGLLGIHWRTRVLSPNVAALAQAAWNQDPFNKISASAPAKTEGPTGGQISAYPNNPITATEDQPLYQTVRYNLSAYQFKVPDGEYTVTLKFCEPHYNEKEKRVFGVKIEGKSAIDRLDVFAKVGQNIATDYTFKDISVNDGWLDIDFIQQIEFPCIAALAIEGKGYTKKINCGGPAYKDFAADWPQSPPKPRGLPTDDFYLDWARAEFGPAVAAKAAEILAKIDGKLPRPSDWVEGPGGLIPDMRPWSEVQKLYVFVDEFSALRDQVKGAGNLDRFDYWRNQLIHIRAMARVKCAWAQFNQVLEKAKAEKNPEAAARMAEENALPAFGHLLQCMRDAYTPMLAFVSNPGELGTVANWNQHILPRVVIRPGQELAKLLGRDLPAFASLSKNYSGPLRVIVPTLRGDIESGTELVLKVIILSEKPPKEAALFWRPLGPGEFTKIPLAHSARGVYSVKLPTTAANGDGLEYYIKATADNGDAVFFPPTAPKLNQTVVIMPTIR